MIGLRSNLKRLVSGLLVVALSTAFVVSSAQAWDGRRLGFLLGAGGGAGALTNDVHDRPAIAGVVEGTLGFAVTNQFAVLLVAPLVWSEYDSTPVKQGRLALQYWMRPDVPSFYFNAGVRAFTSNETNLYLGLGNEFRKHFSVELGVTVTSNSQSDVTLLGKLVVLGY